METVRFGWKSESPHRILAPGLPDIVRGAGGLVAWINAAGFWMWKGESVAFHPDAGAAELLVGDTRSILSCGRGREWEVRTYCNVQLGLCDVRHFEGRSIQCGTDLVVLDTGIERAVYRLDDGERVRVPIGARDAHPQAWQEGPGITWVDQCHVYSQLAGERARWRLRLPVEPTEWVAGPSGTALFACGDVTLALHHTGAVHEFPPIDFESVCFRSDGTHLLCVSERGLVHINLVTGEVVNHRSGSLLPVGFNVEPIVLDEDAGILKWLGGSTICRGFSPSAAAMCDGILYGPGGSAWDVQAGRQLWKESPLCGIFLVAHKDGVFQIDDRIIGYNRAGTRVLDVPLPVDEAIDGEIVDVGLDGETFLFDMGSESILVDFQGNRIGVVETWSLSEHQEIAPTQESREATSAAEELFQADGSLLTADGTWLWGDDGMLVVVREADRQSAH